LQQPCYQDDRAKTRDGELGDGNPAAPTKESGERRATEAGDNLGDEKPAKMRACSLR
jgi:hypothetical protein